jgi:Kef-type K+ transport system membrane component KefB
MGALVVVVMVIIAVVASSRRAPASPRRRAVGVVLVVVAAVGALFAVGSFVGAASGNTEDMDPSQVVVLGCVFLAGAVAVGFAALRLLRRT